jgi:hypothetical protein
MTTLPRLLAPGGSPADLATHNQRYGPLSYGDPAAVLRTLAESGLTGRGGAGFPVVDGKPVPPRTRKRARRAALDCPVLALKLRDS